MIRRAEEFLNSEAGRQWAEEWLDPKTGLIRADKREEAMKPIPLSEILKKSE